MAPVTNSSKLKTGSFFYGTTRRRRRFKSSDAISYAVVRCPSRLPSFSSVWGDGLVSVSLKSEQNQLHPDKARAEGVAASEKEQGEHGNYDSACQRRSIVHQRLKAVRQAEMEDFLQCTYSSLDVEDELYKRLVELLVKDMAEDHRQQSDIFIPFPFGNSCGGVAERVRECGESVNEQRNEELASGASANSIVSVSASPSPTPTVQECNEGSMTTLTTTPTQEPPPSPDLDEFDIDIDWESAGAGSGRGRSLETPEPRVEADGTESPSTALTRDPMEACPCVWLPERQGHCAGASTALELYKLLCE